MLVGLLLSGIFMVYGQLNMNSLSAESYFYYVAGGAFFGLWVFIFACGSIKCPKCGVKWFWLAVRGKGSGSWLFWLSSLTVCPKCGFPDNVQH